MTASFSSEKIDSLVMTWLAGWRSMRGLPEPLPVVGGLRVEFGQPHRLYEFVALSADASPVAFRRLCALARDTNGTNWLTIATRSADTVEATVRESGLELTGPSETLMITQLDMPPTHDLAKDYSLTTKASNDMITVTVTSSTGEVAASGQIAVLPEEATAVPDKIETSPAHRRQGLGSSVMSALIQAAIRQGGARTGLLVASPDGKHLYTSLGWTPVANVLIARS